MRACRARTHQFTFGITRYQWVGELGSLVLYADGQAYIKQDIGDEAIIQITPSEKRHSGFNPSPSGGLISYVRGGNLFYQDIQKAGSEVQVSHDANECVSYGLPDFLAAEEMHRFAGAWWSQCERYLIYCRNDDAPVRVSHRMEIDGNGSRTIAQRYPFAGEANPDVSLHLHDTQSVHSQKIWQSGLATHDAYLARVLPIADGLCLLTQDRLQQTLVLSAYEFTTGNWQELYRETSTTWKSDRHYSNCPVQIYFSPQKIRDNVKPLSLAETVAFVAFEVHRISIISTAVTRIMPTFLAGMLPLSTTIYFGLH